MELLLSALAAYLIGSIPFGLILTRIAGHGDIRKIGSGNIGATNVLRTGDKKLAVLTLLLDGVKGLFATAFVFKLLVDYNLGTDASSLERSLKLISDGGLYGHINNLVAFIGAPFAVLGHVFPVWLKFKGGKGVATTLGVWFGINPFIGGFAVVIWILTAIISRRSSLAAIISILITVLTLTAFEFVCWPVPGEAPVCTPPHYMMLTSQWFIAALVIWRHKDNIKRLLAGTEPKIGKKHD